MKYSRINLILSGLFIVVAFAMGFYIPYGTAGIEENWDGIRREIYGKSVESITAEIREELENFNASASFLMERISNSEDLLDFIPYEEDIQISFSVSFGDSVIVWNDFSPVDEGFLNEIKEGEAYFYSTTLKAFLVRKDFLKVGQNTYLLITQKTVEKFYSFDNYIYEPVSLSDELSEKYAFDCRIDYYKDAEVLLDGAETSFEIKNMKGDKIGVVTIPKPKLDLAKRKFVEDVDKLQSVAIILGVLIFLIGFVREIWNENKAYKYSVIIISLAVFRFLLSAFSLPEKLFKTTLNDPQYFSSGFAGGIAKTPLELFITAVTFIVVLYFAGKLVELFGNRISLLNSKLKLAVQSVITFSAFLTVRAFAASVRSFVFDSGVRYFNVNSLFPALPVTFNLFNLLLVAFALTYLATILIRLFYFLYNHKDKSNRYNSIAAFLIAFIVYAFIDRSGLIPLPLHFLIVACVLLLTGVYRFGKIRITTFYIYLAIGSSIFSIYCLNEFNNELTKNSLKIAGDEVISTKVNLYDFWIRKILSDEAIHSIVLSRDTETNWDAESFLIWNASPFMKEDIPCWVAVYDSSLNILGGYEYLTSEKIPLKISLPDSSEAAIIEKKLNGKNNVIEGKITLNHNGENRYLLFGIEFGALTYSATVEPKFVSPNKYFDRISVNQNEYFILKFNNSGFVDNVGAVELNYNAVKRIEKNLPEGKISNWDLLEIDGDEYLIYLLKGKTVSTIIGLKRKDFSTLLFHFFKILFVHSTIIFIIVFLISLMKYLRKREIVINYRTKLFFSFLVIALIPIIFLAFYLRDLTNTKNMNTIRYKLKKRAVNVEKYIKTNYEGNSYSFESLEKAEKDLGIKFNVYTGNELSYSSFGKYYTTGILSPLINCEPYVKIYAFDHSDYLTKNKIGNLVYNSYYHRIGDYSILEINDAFNSIILPINIDEFDTILFGSYAIASIIIIILSTLLANQISKPIDNLTKATKSISEGDLDITLEGDYSGEMGQLVRAFNYMTKQLKKNANEIARMEREIAWKEMAKQVAHEIKNPLTPMKLSVQHLKAAYGDNSEKFDEIFRKVTDTLVNQIETLGRISSEFSNLAKMPSLKLEKVNLTHAVISAVNLFTDRNVKINIVRPEEEIIINADADNLKRTFINLIRNAIQAGADRIDIEIKQSEEEVIIFINDNGSGIPKELQNKIFDLNFSTKKEGMGIGLSIAKRFIENIGGEILLNPGSENGASFSIILKRGKG